jgi:hypothetical protein
MKNKLILLSFVISLVGASVANAYIPTFSAGFSNGFLLETEVLTNGITVQIGTLPGADATAQNAFATTFGGDLSTLMSDFSTFPGSLATGITADNFGHNGGVTLTTSNVIDQSGDQVFIFATFDVGGPDEQWGLFTSLTDLDWLAGSNDALDGKAMSPTDDIFAYWGAQIDFSITVPTPGDKIGLRLAPGTLIPIPEPSTYALMLIGGLGVFAAYRRRR